MENNSKPIPEKHRVIRSYVLRQGRLTQGQQHALEHFWNDYGIDYRDTVLDFEQIFGNRHPVVIEIGFGNGESLLEQARNHPEFNYIGIEVHAPGVGHLINLAHTTNTRNLRVIRHDAVDVLQNMVANNSIDKIQLFFPDPWHKKRHHKRRIIKPQFIELVAEKLTASGQFHMATDWQPYAEAMQEQMEASTRFENTSGKGHYSPHRGDRCETRFERRGMKLGHRVFDLIYRKSSEKSHN